MVLVPFTSSIIPPCERALEELERQGYPVRRVGGDAAIDQGRNQMSTDALLDGYEETMWIDANVDFHRDAIDRLRSHRLPIVCGVYPQKGKRALACHVMPGSPKMVFGKDGGLVEILYAATGFLVLLLVDVTVAHWKATQCPRAVAPSIEHQKRMSPHRSRHRSTGRASGTPAVATGNPAVCSRMPRTSNGVPAGATHGDFVTLTATRPQNRPQAIRALNRKRSRETGNRS